MSGQPAWFPLAHTDGSIKEAVKEWCKGGDSMEAVKRRFGLIEEWDVSEVTDMYELFKDQKEFDADLSGWDVSKVTNMSFMFEGATTFNADLSGWDVSNVGSGPLYYEGSMDSMFYGATAFDQKLSGSWSTSTANKNGMFKNCPGSIVGS